MKDVGNVGTQQHQSERAQDLGALGGDDPSHHGEHTDGGEADDERHQAVDDLIEGGDDVAAQLALFAGSHDSTAEEEGDDDDLQHVGLGEGIPHIAGEDADQSVHEVGTGGLLPHGALFQSQGGEQARTVEDVGHDQTDDAGDSGGAEEVRHGLPAHGADLLHVIHGENTVDHGEQHHGNNDELQEVDENGAKGLQVVGSKVGCASEIADQTDSDAQDQGNQDLHGKADFFLHTLTSIKNFRSLSHLRSQLSVLKRTPLLYSIQKDGPFVKNLSKKT